MDNNLKNVSQSQTLPQNKETNMFALAGFVASLLSACFYILNILTFNGPKVIPTGNGVAPISYGYPFILGLLIAILALIFCIIGLKSSKNYQKSYRALVIVGIILASLILLISVFSCLLVYFATIVF